MDRIPSQRRRGRWIAALGLLGVAAAPPVAPLRRAVVERLLRLRNLTGDPAAPFLEAPCERERLAPPAPVDRAEVVR